MVLPANTATTIIDSLSSVLSDNIGVVITLLAFSVGISLVFRLLRKYTKVKA